MNNPNIELSSLNEEEAIQPITISETTSKSFVDIDLNKHVPDSHQKNKLYFDELKDNKVSKGKENESNLQAMYRT